jgi:hypothetical protein
VAVRVKSARHLGAARAVRRQRGAHGGAERGLGPLAHLARAMRVVSAAKTLLAPQAKQVGAALSCFGVATQRACSTHLRHARLRRGAAAAHRCTRRLQTSATCGAARRQRRARCVLRRGISATARVRCAAPLPRGAARRRCRLQPHAAAAHALRAAALRSLALAQQRRRSAARKHRSSSHAPRLVDARLSPSCRKPPARVLQHVNTESYQTARRGVSRLTAPASLNLTAAETRPETAPRRAQPSGAAPPRKRCAGTATGGG